jgi:pantoate kinase
LIDLTRIAEASALTMTAVSIQDDADVARQSSARQLMQQPPLVKPIEESQRFSKDTGFVGQPSSPYCPIDIDQGGAGG